MQTDVGWATVGRFGSTAAVHGADTLIDTSDDAANKRRTISSTTPLTASFHLQNIDIMYTFEQMNIIVVVVHHPSAPHRLAQPNTTWTVTTPTATRNTAAPPTLHLFSRPQT